MVAVIGDFGLATRIPKKDDPRLPQVPQYPFSLQRDVREIPNLVSLAVRTQLKKVKALPAG